MTFVRPDFCDASVCRRIRMAMEHGDASPAEVYADGYRLDDAARRSFDVEVRDDIVSHVQQAIDAMRPIVGRFFRVALSGEEGPGFLRYAAGGFYRRHCDVISDWVEDFPRRISVVVFLTTAGEECQGGALRIYGCETLDILPKAGTLVAFPSDVPHEVLPVTAGVRDVVVDWFF